MHVQRAVNRSTVLKRLLLLLLSRLYIIRDIHTKLCPLVAHLYVHTPPNEFICPASDCILTHTERPEYLIDPSKQPSSCKYGIQNRNMPKLRLSRR